MINSDYGDDGLGIFRNISRPEIERKKKAIVKVFKKCGLSIVVDTKLKTVDFLDVTFDLTKIYPNLVESPIIVPPTSIKTRTIFQIF